MELRERWMTLKEKITLFTVLWYRRGIPVRECWSVVKQVDVDVTSNSIEDGRKQIEDGDYVSLEEVKEEFDKDNEDYEQETRC